MGSVNIFKMFTLHTLSSKSRQHQDKFMKMPRFEPGASESEAPTLPLCYESKSLGSFLDDILDSLVGSTDDAIDQILNEMRHDEDLETDEEHLSGFL